LVRQRLALAHRLGVLFPTLALLPVGLDASLDAILGLNVRQLLLALPGGLLDLLLALELLLDVLRLLGGLQTDLLEGGSVKRRRRMYGSTHLIPLSLFLLSDGLVRSLLLQLLAELLESRLLFLLGQRGKLLC
jgi:hypothetical protein